MESNYGPTTVGDLITYYGLEDDDIVLSKDTFDLPVIALYVPIDSVMGCAHCAGTIRNQPALRFDGVLFDGVDCLVGSLSEGYASR